MRLGCDPAADLVGDRTGQFPLQLQQIGELALVGVRPDVVVRHAVDELDGQPHASAGTLHRTLDDGVDAQFACDLRQRLVGPFESHHRGAGDDAQAVNLREARDHLVGHAVGEVLLNRISRQVL